MKSGIEFGDTVVIQGSGAIGIVTRVCAKVGGAGHLILVGGPPGRLELGKRLGADMTVDIAEIPNPEERAQIVKDCTPRGEGADVVFECAGFLGAISEGLGYLARNRTYVEMGHFVDVGTIEFNPNTMMMRKSPKMQAIWGSRPEHFVRATPILERRELPLEDLVSNVIPL